MERVRAPVGRNAQPEYGAQASERCMPQYPAYSIASCGRAVPIFRTMRFWFAHRLKRKTGAHFSAARRLKRKTDAHFR
jgi:hypothetical protein